MKNKSEQLSSQITFANRPLVNDWDTAEERVFRSNVVSAIRELISSSQEFRRDSVQVKFFHSGVTSIACCLTSNGKRAVLKIPLFLNQGAGEGQFLKSWENIGVAVPHVIREGRILDRSYTLMSYVDAKPLNEAISGERMLRSHIFDEMGQTLRKLHTIGATGYGRFSDGKGQYGLFREWLENDTRWHVAYVRERQLLDQNQHGSIEIACDILSDYLKTDDRTVYCHNDFSVCNLFDTSPMTVFDPNPLINHPYLDLARSVVLIAKAKIELQEPARRLIDGYTGNDRPIDPGVLRSCILLQAHLKFPFWDQTNQRNEIDRVRKYLSQRDIRRR